MAIPYLPGLNKDNKIVTHRGVWQSDPQTKLTNLIEDLKVTADYKSSINSIPDLWARPAMFENVLAHTSHHLFTKYQAEWRGILAILALREMRGFKDIEVLTVKIPLVSKLKPSDPALLHIIAHLLTDEYQKFPDPTAEAGYKMHIITFEGEPLAVVWPTLLICPAVELQKGYQNPVSWWHYDGIADPISFLNEEEKGVLTDWLKSLQEEIYEIGALYKGKTNIKIGILLGLLKKFIDDLNFTGASNAARYRAGRSLKITGFCEKLGVANAIVQDEKSFLAASHVLLSNQRGTNAKNLLVMAPDMVQQWNKAASDIVVGGYYSLDAALPQATGTLFTKDEIGGTSLIPYNAELRMGEDFFTEQICIIYNDVPIFPNAIRNIVINYRGSQVNVLMPIKAELLDYLDPSFLAENIAISPKEENIEVELKLPLSGFGTGGEKMLTVRKVYHADTGKGEVNEIRYLGSLPMLQIWPNFIMEEGKEKNWQYYYSFYHNKGEATFNARPYWSEEDKIATRQLGNVGEIALGKSFPQAYTCIIKEEAYGKSKETPIGVILLNLPERPLVFDAATRKATIGIDFGTTNTVAYMFVDSKTEPFLICFDNYDDEKEKLKKKGNYRALLYDVTANDDPVCKEKGRRNFIAMTDQPNLPHQRSIRTIFHTHTGTLTIDADYPLLKGNIYYMDDGDSIIADKDLLKDLQTTEMKWDAQGVESMKGFLWELGMQCMAEAVKEGATEIDWAFSYPTSFTRKMIDNFEKLWNNQLLPAFAKISATSSISYVKNTESVAMAEYFVNKMRATPNTGIICLDIGGGSTDIAIWQGSNNEIRYQASLRFAGKKILNDQLFDHREDYLADLKSTDPAINDILETARKERNKKQFDLLIEALLQCYENKIFDSLTSKGTLESIGILVRNITFALAGLFFYSGIVVGYLRVNGKYGEYKDLPSCYVGGNGSKLLHWAAMGRFGPSLAVNDVFKACLLDGVDVGEDWQYKQDKGLPYDAKIQNGYSEEFEIYQSDDPKEEVAYGLVIKGIMSQTAGGGVAPSNQRGGLRAGSGSGLRGGGAAYAAPRKADTDNAVEDIIAGEDYVLPGKPEGRAVDILEEQDFLNGVQINRSLRVFKIFLNQFNYQAERLGLPVVDLDDSTCGKICAQVNQELANKKTNAKGKKEDVAKEPLFIIILKTTLGMLR